MTIEQLSEKRKELRQQLIENEAMEGFKGLLTLLYSDKVHFIYELLQNAEDAKASEVKFFLNTDRLEFEHNGHELFTIEDVDSITNIGSSTKADDVTNIGKFGIGFKAVFAYTSTPEIESGPFHFRIHDMFVPETEDLTPGSLGQKRTRFIFPFDNPEKPPEMASADIKAKLHQLDANTLLFLSNICKIEYQFPDLTNGYLKRIESTNDKNRIEISTMRPGNLVPDSIHYLKFTKDVDVQDEDGRLKPCRIAIAFSLDKPEKGEWKIKPLNPGQVSIYFPAAKEPSNLLFHLHAPFASTVARDSVRDCPANDELRNHISELIAESMTTIHSRGLLDVDFLATLPNDKDQIRYFYQPILKRLVEEFNTKKLVPMKQGEYAIASGSYRTARGERTLSDLINDQDLTTLLEKGDSLPLWIANPPQINQREDNFLSMLDISEWTIEDLIEVLETQSDTVIEWLKQKSDEWHQELYAFLQDNLSNYYETELQKLCIVHCVDGIYRVGSECHFSSSDIDSDEDLFTVSTEVDDEGKTESHEEESQEENFYYVSNAVYSSGNNKNQQESARKFLETIGVTEVNETERVKVILKQRYSRDSIKPQDEDMKRFIDLVNEKPETKSIFKDYYIFEIDLQRDNKRLFRRPSGVFVDSPYLNTGLTAYFETIDEDSDSFKRALSPNYAKPESRVDSEDIGKFAEVVGAQTKLETVEQRIPSEHPQSDYLYSAPGDKESYYSINEDYIIPEFSILLNMLSIDKSKLIWRTMSYLPESYLKSRYRKNASNNCHYGYSSVVHQLRNAKWVPQNDGVSISFVCSCNASIDNLPEGFPYETGQEWLEAIEFSKTATEQKAEYIDRNQKARDFGFDSGDDAEECADFYRQCKEKGMSIDDLKSELGFRSSKVNPDFPTSPVRNPEYRRKRILEKIKNAPKKEYVEKIRNMRGTKEDIDQRTSLKEWYMNDLGEMVCQICRKVMPFKKTDGEYYFVAIEALTIRFMNDQLPENHFLKELEAQYLALCPECAARYDYFVRAVKDGVTVMEELRNHLINSEDMEFPLKLGELDTSIRFVEAHFKDLKAALHYYENPHDAKDSTD